MTSWTVNCVCVCVEQMIIMMEEMVVILNRFKQQSSKPAVLRLPTEEMRDLYQRGLQYLKMIKIWCRKQRGELKKEQQDGVKERGTLMMEKLLDAYTKWCEEKEKKLKEYGRELGINQTRGSEGEETSLLNYP